MKNNDIFNFQRFGKYFVSDLKTCRANYGLTLLVISVLVPSALYVIYTALNGVFAHKWGGPDIFIRLFVFAMAMLCMTVTMPVKCYGKLTDKQYGSLWISIPASRLEKFLSMVIIVSMVAPLASAVLYLLVDYLLCMADYTCGKSLIGGGIWFLREFEGGKEAILATMAADVPEIAESFKSILNQISSPWLYIDEYLAMCLPFLLGAIYFKNSKIVKTFLALAALSTVVSMIATPLMAGYYIDMLTGSLSEEEAMIKMYSSGLFKNIVLLDIISDTLANTALLAGIWFRIKTIKH